MKGSKLIGRLLHPLLTAAAVGFLGLGAASAAPAAESPHAQALGALGDLEAAIGELDSASRLMEHAPDPYKAAAQRALDALTGAKGSQPAGASADKEGAIGHLKQLNAHAGSAPWKAAVQGAEVHASVAQSQLSEAIDAGDLEHFQVSASSALEALLAAVGRDSDAGPMGGLQGALATTSLGVPEDAMMVSGCDTPKLTPGETPAYGVTNGHLIFVAVRDREQNTRLPESIGSRDIAVTNGVVILYTAATDEVKTLCPDAAQPSGSAGDEKSSAANSAPASSAAGASNASQQSGDQKSPGPAKLYTEAQAEQGKQLYAQHCAACHGDQLQGKSAPAIAGTAS